MSKRSYSKDLRTRVIDYIKQGKSQISASKTYKISKSTVSRWWLIYQKEKRLTCKARGGSKGKINPSSLSKFVEENPDKTLSEIGEVFGIKASSVYYRLKSLDFSYKKKPSPMWKQMKKSVKNIKSK